MTLLTLRVLAWALAAKLALTGPWADDGRDAGMQPPELVERDPGWRDPPDRPRPRPDRDYLPFLMPDTMASSPAAARRDGSRHG